MIGCATAFAAAYISRIWWSVAVASTVRYTSMQHFVGPDTISANVTTLTAMPNHRNPNIRTAYGSRLYMLAGPMFRALYHPRCTRRLQSRLPAIEIVFYTEDPLLLLLLLQSPQTMHTIATTCPSISVFQVASHNRISDTIQTQITGLISPAPKPETECVTAYATWISMQVPSNSVGSSFTIYTQSRHPPQVIFGPNSLRY